MNAKIFSKLKDKTLFSLEGRTAVVTGAAQGIGLNIARGFAYAGCNVAMCDINMETATQQSELLNKELNSRISLPIHIDVTKLADIERMIECTVKEYGRMDIAVNNAGIQSQHWLHTQVLYHIIHVTLLLNYRFVPRFVGETKNILCKMLCELLSHIVFKHVPIKCQYCNK